MSSTIGFIGLGHMGGPMAQNLLKAGHRLQVFDLVPQAVQALAQAGATAASSAAEAVAGADLVVGHHSHVVSGVEKYKGKYIAYGLGTLSSAILTPDDMDNIVFQQTFRVIPDLGHVEEESVRLIACSTSSSSGSTGIA